MHALPYHRLEPASPAGKLDRLTSVRGQRLRALEQRNQGITRLVYWLEANRHKFKGPVLGPLACEVTVADPLHAAYLEQQCQCAPAVDTIRV